MYAVYVNPGFVGTYVLISEEFDTTNSESIFCSRFRNG